MFGILVPRSDGMITERAKPKWIGFPFSCTLRMPACIPTSAKANGARDQSKALSSKRQKALLKSAIENRQD